MLLLGARLAKHLTPAKRDRLLLHLLMQAEPLASASGDQGFALLLLHADFHWDMDVAWLQEARRRMGADAPTLARKLGAPNPNPNPSPNPKANPNPSPNPNPPGAAQRLARRCAGPDTGRHTPG